MKILKCQTLIKQAGFVLSMIFVCSCSLNPPRIYEIGDGVESIFTLNPIQKAVFDSTRNIYRVTLPAENYSDIKLSILLKKDWNHDYPETESVEIGKEINFSTYFQNQSSNVKVIVELSNWRRLSNKAAFTTRDGAVGVEFKGQAYLLGGWSDQTGTTSSEVWKSVDGANWEKVGDATWPARHSFSAFEFNGKLWVVGGDGNTDVWNSDDAVTWSCINASAPWGARYLPYCGVFNGRIWLMGGQSIASGWKRFDQTMNISAYNDVWSSADGMEWTKHKDAPWQPRSLIHGFAVKDNRIWIIGGGIKGAFPYTGHAETVVEFSDVWNTSDGETWIKTGNYNIEPRTHFSITVYNGMFFLSDGSVGTQANLSGNIYKSENGINWSVDQEYFIPNRHASSLFEFNDSLYLAAGYGQNDIWVRTRGIW